MNAPTIILAHSGLKRAITEEECRAALPEGSEAIFLNIVIAEVLLSQLEDLPFEQLALEQQRYFKAKIEPVLKRHPNAVLAYFGLVPIPLAVHLGYLCGNLRPCQYYQLHHHTCEWYLDMEPPAGCPFDLEPSDFPKEIQRGLGDVFVRVGTSVRIDPQHTNAVLWPTNEFDLVLTQPHVDSLANQEQLGQVVDRFQDILGAYATYLSDRKKVHLFIAGTPALAFALGRRINPTILPNVQTYQYYSDAEVRYKEAILITKQSDDAIAYSEEDRTQAAEIRTQWQNELRLGIHSFIINNTGTGNNWFDDILLKQEHLKSCLIKPWDQLPALDCTSLKDDQIDLKAIDVSDGFEYDHVNRFWKIDDGMFVSLHKRLSRVEEADLTQAGRLFFFHEGLHYCNSGGHHLTGSMASGIGRFPKVIEAADYQADVYALLYEYRYSRIKNVNDVDGNLKKFFSTAITTATETMWSFLDNEVALEAIQIRSMNRFLNWYFQSVRIENLEGKGTLGEIIDILFDKPIIEVAGPPPFIMNERRIAIRLKESGKEHFEVAIFYNNKIYRTSPVGMKQLIKGFRTMDTRLIKEVLRNFYMGIQ